jgi:hypothetical protein
MTLARTLMLAVTAVGFGHWAYSAPATAHGQVKVRTGPTSAQLLQTQMHKRVTGSPPHKALVAHTPPQHVQVRKNSKS